MKWQAAKAFIRDNFNRYSHNTICAYETSIKSFLEFTSKELNEVRKKDIKAWLLQLNDEGKKPATVLLRFIAIRVFFEYCTSEDIVSKNPTLTLELPKVDQTLPKFLDKPSMHKLRNAIGKNLKHRAIFETLYSTGVRVSELINIEINDIKSWDERKIWIKEGRIRRTNSLILSRL